MRQRPLLAAAVAALVMSGGTSAALAAQTTQNPCTTASAVKVCLVAPEPLRAGGAVRMELSGALASTTKAGDTLAVQLPQVLQAMNGTSTPVIASDGSVMGTLVVSGDRVQVTWNNWIETHPLDASWSGWLQLSAGTSLADGPNQLPFTVNQESVTLTVDGATCETACTTMPNTAQKWASVTSPGHIDTTLLSPTVTKDGQALTWTDTVGAGQEIDCTKIGAAAYSSRDPKTGYMIWSSGFGLKVTSCTPQQVTGEFSATKAGIAYAMLVPVTITDASLGSWSDDGVVSVDGASRNVHAVAVARSAGASGTGTPKPVANQPAVPSPTLPEQTPAPTATATATPSTTATATSTTPAQPTASSSVTPEPTATATPGDTETATPSEPAPTVSANPNATASPLPTSDPTATSDPTQTPTTTPTMAPNVTPIELVPDTASSPAANATALAPAASAGTTNTTGVSAAAQSSNNAPARSVVQQDTSTDNQLAYTGSETLTLLGTGLGLMALGLIGVVVGRRDRLNP